MTPTLSSRQTTESKRTEDYGYSNARVRGMKARLMGSDKLERLLRSEDLKTVLQDLMHGEYAEDLEEVLIHGRGAAEIDEALRHNLVRTYNKVLGFLNSEAYDICSVLLGRWDVFNLKTVLRGKHLHLSDAEIREALLPVGAMGETDLNGLLSAPDVRGVVDLASTWGLPHASALRRGFAEQLRTGVMANLELPLDRHYAEWASAELSRRSPNYQRARWVLGTQIDHLNLIIVFRAARENLPPEQSEEYFLAGGSDIRLDKFQRLAIMSDTDEILDELRGTRYGPALDEAAVRYLETQSLAVFERALEDHLTRGILSLGTTDPLGVGIPIAYLWAKLNEVTNLRIIVKGKSVGLPLDRTRKELILV
jgi:V/A-type H+-transporting ATPase subunit C